MARWRTVRTPAELAQVLADGDYAEIVGNGHYEVSGSVSVRAYDSVSVRAYDSVSVRAYGSVSVRAYDSVSVTAYGSVSVTAYGSVSVRAYDSVSVTAGNRVAVHKHAVNVHIGGGVLIDHTDIDLTDTTTWLDNYGIDTAEDGTVTLYKGVDDTYKSDHGADYTPGIEVTCDDWNTRNKCGGGLHLSPTPSHTLEYTDARRYVACTVFAVDVVVIGSRSGANKCKVPRILSTVEVDEHARPLPVKAVS